MTAIKMVRSWFCIFYKAAKHVVNKENYIGKLDVQHKGVCSYHLKLKLKVVNN